MRFALSSRRSFTVENLSDIKVTLKIKINVYISEDTDKASQESSQQIGLSNPNID